MRKTLPLVALAVAACWVAFSVAASRAGERAACGRELWSLKTLSDPERGRVDLHPRDTTISAIESLQAPRRTPTGRSTAFQRHVWRVVASIDSYKLEADRDIHLILFGDGKYLIAEMPAASCLPTTTRDRRAIISVRRLFESHCGTATDAWSSLGAVVRISGVGFWDFAHGQSGHASNFAELHPVTAIKFISGCGA